MTLVIDLKPELQEEPESIAARRGLDLPHLVVETREKLEPSTPKARREGENTGGYLLRVAYVARASIPEADRNGPARDHARNYTHSLYGAPKEQ